MRIALLIIRLCLTAILGLQCCAMHVGGSLLQQQGGGAIGIMMALLFVVGVAFATGLPWVSVVTFALAALFGLVAGASTNFRDLSTWGGLALVLRVMSYFGSRELSKKRRLSTPEAEKAAPMTLAPSNLENPVTDADSARTNAAVDALRRFGRGGVVTVSLTLAAAGEDAIVEALRAVAACAPTNDGRQGQTGTPFGSVFWSIDVRSSGALSMSVWLEADLW